MSLELEVDDLFQCNLLIIRVENRIFRAPRELFEQYSVVFKDMFSLPSLDGELQDGERDGKPLVLEGIKKDDFRAFLTVLSCLHYESMASNASKDRTVFVVARFPLYKDIAAQHWVAVLRLAHMWGFDNVRKKAIEVLEADEELSKNTLERLKLALEFTIQNWIRSAYGDLIKRDLPLTEDEAPWLAPDIVQNVNKARDEFIKVFLARILGRSIELPYCRCGRGLQFVSNQGSTPSLYYLSCGYSFCGRKLCVEEAVRASFDTPKGNILAKGDLDRIIHRFLSSE